MTDSSSISQPGAAVVPRPFKRILSVVVGVILLIGAVVAAARWWSVGRYQVSTDNAYVRADIVTLSPRVAGYVAGVEVQDNQHVEVGQILARIDDRDYRARVAQAAAAVEAAKADIAAQQASIANIDAQVLEQRSHIAAAAAEVEASRAALQRATLEFQRQQLLSRQLATSRQQLEAADAEFKRTEAVVTSAQAGLAASGTRRLVLNTERDRARSTLEKARAVLAQARAELTLAQIDLQYCAITAPVTGVVGQRSVRVGQYVEVGTPALAIVPEETYIVANYKETQLQRVVRGQRVSIEVDAFGAAPLSGHVESFAPASGAQFALLPPDNATGNFTKIVQRVPVRISLDGGQPRARDLRPGMSVVTVVDTSPGTARER